MHILTLCEILQISIFGYAEHVYIRIKSWVLHWVVSYRLSNAAYNKLLCLGHFLLVFQYGQWSVCMITLSSELHILDGYTNKTKKSLSKLIKNFRRYEFFKFQDWVKKKLKWETSTCHICFSITLLQMCKQISFYILMHTVKINCQ